MVPTSLISFWNGEGFPTPNYGNIAIVKLIEKVLAFPGSNKSKLVVKVFAAPPCGKNRIACLPSATGI
jgi:chemotaxis protein CheD